MSRDYTKRQYKVTLEYSENRYPNTGWHNYEDTNGTLKAMAKALPVLRIGEVWSVERIEDTEEE